MQTKLRSSVPKTRDLPDFITAAERGKESLPKSIPKGWYLVHNHIRPVDGKGRRIPGKDLGSVIGWSGFRAWIQNSKRPYVKRFGKEVVRCGGLVPCDCGFAPHLGTHYKVG